MALLAAPASWKPLARHLAQAVLPETLVLLVLLLLLADCSAKAAVVVVEVRLVLAAVAAQVVVAQVAVGVRVVAAHMQQVLVAWVAMAGHWYWSFEHETVCRC